MKRHIATLILSILSLTHILAAPTEIDDVPNVHVADSTRFVSNPDGVLSPACVDSLDMILRQAWRQSTAEPVVVALRDIPERYEPIRFAVELGEKWGVGKADKDNGVIILLLTDRRKMTIATGKGADGALPDVVCNRIIRDVAIPYFRHGDYDGGMLAATSAVCRVLTDPRYAQELRSGIPSNSRRHAGDDDEFSLFRFVLSFGVVMLVVMLVVVIYTYASTRRLDEVVRYERLGNIKPVAMFLSFMGIGIPLPAFLLCAFLMNRLRNHRRDCPNCGTAMKKLDEVTDNRYLTAAQDREEQLDSIDYDVWLCPQCGETDVIPYINKKSDLVPCPKCGARAAQLIGNRTMLQPTTRAAGLGEKIYYCKNCGTTSRIPYEIAKLAAPVVIMGPGIGGRHGGGGFGGGGSFGGGSFGGGGATGGW